MSPWCAPIAAVPQGLLLGSLLLLLVAVAAPANAAECLAMCTPCSSDAECCNTNGFCGCVRNLIPGPGAPPKVCMCQGSSLTDCQMDNAAKAKAATAAAAAAAGKPVKPASVTPPKCVQLPPNATRKVPCEEDTPPPGNGTTVASTTAAVAPSSTATAAP